MFVLKLEPETNGKIHMSTSFNIQKCLQAQLRCYKREALTPSIWNPALQGTSLSYTLLFSPKHLYLLTLDTELDPKRILQLPR